MELPSDPALPLRRIQAGDIQTVLATKAHYSQEPSWSSLLPIDGWVDKGHEVC